MVALVCNREKGLRVVNEIRIENGDSPLTVDQFNEMLPPVEYVVFADTGAEWDHTYANIEYAKRACEVAGIPFVVVHNEYRGPIDEYIKERGIVPFFNGGKHTCSKIWKQKPMQDFAKETFGDDTVVRWAVGISFDETARMSKFNGLDKKALDQGQISRFPMTDMRITRFDEEQILDRMNWKPDGKIVRLSACYHCPYNTESDLRLLRTKNPDLWQKAVDIEQAFFDNTNYQNWLDAGKPLNGRCNNIVDGKKCNTKPIADQDHCDGCGQEYNGVRRAPHGMWADDYANRKDDPQRLIQRNGPHGRLMSMNEWGEYIDDGRLPMVDGQTRLFDHGCFGGGCGSKDILFDDEASVSIYSIMILLFLPIILIVNMASVLVRPITINVDDDFTIVDHDGVVESFNTGGGKSAPDADGNQVDLLWAVPSLNADGFKHSSEQAVGLNHLYYGLVRWAEGGEPVRQIVEAVAGSGKTTYIKSVAKLMANLGLGEYRIILTAFNRHIAKDLNQVATDLGPVLSGFVRMGGSNTVQAAGLSEILKPNATQRGIDLEVDQNKPRGISRVVLYDAIGQHKVLETIVERGVEDNANFFGGWYAISDALKDFVSSVMDAGIRPYIIQDDETFIDNENWDSDIAAFISAKSSILNWAESPLYPIPSVILNQMVKRCIYESQRLVFDAAKPLKPSVGAKMPNGERGMRRSIFTVSGDCTAVAIKIKAICPEPAQKSGGGNRRKITSGVKRSGCKGSTKSMIEGGPVFDIKRCTMDWDEETRQEFLEAPVNLPMYVRFSSYDAGNKNVDAKVLEKCKINVGRTYQRGGGTSIRAAIGHLSKVGTGRDTVVRSDVGGIYRWKITDKRAAQKAMGVLARHFGTGASGVYVHEEVEEEKDANPIGVVSFDDMTYTPFYYNLRPPQPAAFLAVDEVQDLSVLKGDMVRRFTDDTTNILLVGDRRQALYLFAGADGAAMTKNGESFNCEAIPMTICWRNGNHVVENAHAMMKWGIMECLHGETPVDLRKTEVPRYADHRAPPIEGWRDGACTIKMPAHLVPHFIETGDITCSRVVSPLARIAINTLREGKPVVLPAGGNDGIDAIVKKHWQGRRPTKGTRQTKVQGLDLPVSTKGRKDHHPRQVSITDIRNRIEDFLNYRRQSIIRSAGNDPKAVAKDDSYQNLVDETDCILALAEGWLEQTGDMNESRRGITYRADPADFLPWLNQFLGQTEGRNGEDSIRFASVHRVKGAQGGVCFMVMDRIVVNKKTGEEEVRGAFMLQHCMETPDEAVQELNAVYVAATRAINQTVLVSHDKDMIELFPTKESFQPIWDAAKSGDKNALNAAMQAAMSPEAQQTREDDAEAERVEAMAVKADLEHEDDHACMNCDWTGPTKDLDHSLEPPACPQCSGMNDVPSVDNKCLDCGIELAADADVNECAECGGILCKEYSGRDESGPHGCGTPASFDDMMNDTGRVICSPCHVEKQMASGESVNLKGDESGAVDIVSIFMLMFAPLVLMVNATYRLYNRVGQAIFIDLNEELTLVRLSDGKKGSGCFTKNRMPHHMVDMHNAMIRESPNDIQLQKYVEEEMRIWRDESYIWSACVDEEASAKNTLYAGFDEEHMVDMKAIVYQHNAPFGVKARNEYYDAQVEYRAMNKLKKLVEQDIDEMVDDENAAVSLYGIVMLFLMPLLFIVNMAKAVKKIIPAYTVAERDALDDENGTKYYEQGKVMTDRSAFYQKQGFFLHCNSCGEHGFHNFTDVEKYPQQRYNLGRHNGFSRQRTFSVGCVSCGGRTKHSKQPAPPEWSPKSLTTVEQMGTRPDQWGIAPVKFEKVRIEEFVKCTHSEIREGAYNYSRDKWVIPMLKWIRENREERIHGKWRIDRKGNLKDNIFSCMGSGRIIKVITPKNAINEWRDMHPIVREDGEDYNAFAERSEANDKAMELPKVFAHITNKDTTLRSDLVHIDLRTWRERLEVVDKRVKEGDDWITVQEDNPDYQPLDENNQTWCLVIEEQCSSCVDGNTHESYKQEAVPYVRLGDTISPNKRGLGIHAGPDTRGYWRKVVLTKGTVVWPEQNIPFRSRFSHHDCMVCGKPHIKSGLVPVMAQDDEGEWNRMWVGQDCAKKFLGFMQFDISMDSCKKCNAEAGTITEEAVPSFSKRAAGDPFILQYDCSKCKSVGSHEEMVQEHDMTISEGSEHRVVQVVKAKDVGASIRWVQDDGTLYLQPHERQ